MKPRQQAILDTVRRYAVIVRERRDPVCHCILCRVAKDLCCNCPYHEVFGADCVYDLGPKPMCFSKEKLRRAMTLARQYTVGEQAIVIVRRVFSK